MNLARLFAQRIDAMRRRWSGRAPEEHERRLVQLYWNRAELKKELANLQTQQLTLQTKIKQMEEARLHDEARVAKLYEYLGDPRSGRHALVHFQLRELWRTGVSLVHGFSDELRQQQEDRERRRHQQHIAAQRQAQLDEIGHRSTAAREQVGLLQVEIGAQEQRKQQLRAPWRYFRRRDANKEIERLAAQLRVASAEAAEIDDELAAAQAALATPFPGLSVEGRRIVNTATIAYGSFLIAALPHRALAPLAKHAMAAQVYDVAYGSQQECEQLTGLITTALASLADSERRLSALKEPTDSIRAHARYRSDLDTVPVTESVEEIGVEQPWPSGALHAEISSTTRINLLADDYWLLVQRLLR